ncbi:MAG: TRAP transporter small permease [Bacillaceae bacterium]|nr:TRAP transporter small permease [Bacillaceae bacterium]
MEKFVRWIDRVSSFFGVIAGLMMLAGVALVITEILVRTLMDRTIYITEEYTAYLMVGITFLGLAYTLKEKGHIRMVFLHKFVKGKARVFLDLYAFLAGFAIFAVITYTTADFFWDSVESGTRSMQISRTYLAIPQSMMPLGSLLMTLQFSAEVIRSVIKLRSGELDDEETESQALGR